MTYIKPISIRKLKKKYFLSFKITYCVNVDMSMGSCYISKLACALPINGDIFINKKTFQRHFTYYNRHWDKVFTENVFKDTKYLYVEEVIICDTNHNNIPAYKVFDTKEEMIKWKLKL